MTQYGLRNCAPSHRPQKCCRRCRQSSCRGRSGRGTGPPPLVFVAMATLSSPLKWARLSQLSYKRRIASERGAHTIGARPLCVRRIIEEKTSAANRGPARHPQTDLGIFGLEIWAARGLDGLSQPAWDPRSVHRFRESCRARPERQEATPRAATRKHLRGARRPAGVTVARGPQYRPNFNVCVIAKFMAAECWPGDHAGRGQAGC